MSVSRNRFSFILALSKSGGEGKEERLSGIVPSTYPLMRTIRIACFVPLLLAPLTMALGQGFVNLDFEQSTIVSSSQSPDGPLDFGIASVPGWTASSSFGLVSNYSGGTALWYNNGTLSSPSISLVGKDFFFPAIDGQYSIALFPGQVPTNYPPPSIWQVGQIPATARSMFYLGNSVNQVIVSFSGHILTINNIDNYGGYSLFGADVSAYAGQTGELLFTQPVYLHYSVIDDITFSSSEIPEPSVFHLSSICILFLYWRMTRQLEGRARIEDVK